MFVIIGIIAVCTCVIGSYMAMGGKLAVLNQPFEVTLIFGAGISAFLISNPMRVVKASFGRLGGIFKGPKYKKPDYLELLTMQYQVFKLMKQKGALALEAHVENPHDSTLFKEFPTFHKDHHAVDFFCDYVRLLTLGSDNPHEIESLMEQELEVHHHGDHTVAHALTNMAESFPALGIVAAVLGVIKTMGSISEPPRSSRKPDRRCAGRDFLGYPSVLWFFCAVRQRGQADHGRGVDLLLLHEGGDHRPPARICAAGFGGIRTQGAGRPQPPVLCRGRGGLWQPAGAAITGIRRDPTPVHLAGFSFG